MFFGIDEVEHLVKLGCKEIESRENACDEFMRYRRLVPGCTAS